MRAKSFATAVFFFVVLTFDATPLYADATVIQSGSPAFPLEIDRIVLTIVNNHTKNRVDTVSRVLRQNLYAELRDNIDTVFSYADALRLHRSELSVSAESSSAYLTFEYLGLPAMKVFLQNPTCKSAKLSSSTDRYPYVIVFTKGFSTQLRKLLRGTP